jgi:hypothetical protein
VERFVTNTGDKMTVNQLNDILKTLIDSGCGEHFVIKGDGEESAKGLFVGTVTEDGFVPYEGDYVSDENCNAVMIV